MSVALSQGEATAIVVKAARGFGLSWGWQKRRVGPFANWVNMAMTRFHGLNVHLMGPRKLPHHDWGNLDGSCTPSKQRCATGG